MPEITFEQEVKLQLVLLAEYLQVKDGLSDDQIKMYASDLMELGSEGLARAITCLKADPEVWAGRMPLPAKLKQYVYGDANMLASDWAREIMSMESERHAYHSLSLMKLKVAQEYGLRAIVDRLPAQSPTIFAQLRDSLRGMIIQERQLKVQHGLPRASDLIGIGSTELKVDLEQDEVRRELETRRPGDSGV